MPNVLNYYLIKNNLIHNYKHYKKIHIFEFQ